MAKTQADWGFLTPSVQRADGSYIGTLENLSYDSGGRRVAQVSPVLAYLGVFINRFL